MHLFADWAVLADVANPTTSGELWFAGFAALVAVLGLVAAAIAHWLHTKAQSSKSFLVLERFWALASAVVAHVQVKIRPSIQRAFADGKLTTEERKALQDEALRLLKEAAGQHGLEELRKALGLLGGNVEVYLSGLLERAFRSFKAQEAPPSVGPLAASTPVLPPGVVAKASVPFPTPPGLK